MHGACQIIPVFTILRYHHITGFCCTLRSCKRIPIYNKVNAIRIVFTVYNWIIIFPCDVSAKTSQRKNTAAVNKSTLRSKSIAAHICILTSDAKISLYAVRNSVLWTSCFKGISIGRCTAFCSFFIPFS